MSEIIYNLGLWFRCNFKRGGGILLSRVESFVQLVEGIIYGENLCKIVLEFELGVQKEMFFKEKVYR